MPSKKYEHLLSDPNVKRWYNNISKGSTILCDVNLRILGRFCAAIGMSSAQYVALSRRKMEDLAQDFVDKLESSKNLAGKPISPAYVENCLTAIRSWAEWNRKPIERKIKIANSNSTPTLENERSPTQDELRRVLYADSTPLRTRASIGLMAFAGPRPEVQGDYEGLDGLRIRDLPELEIKGDTVNFKAIPTIIIVRPELSKIRKQYFTFLGEEGCEILKLYLEHRIKKGEKITSESGVITTSKDQGERASRLGIKDQSPFLRTPKISSSIKKAMLSVGLPWRPYVFRVYFDTNLLLAESKGMVSHAYQQFWMGHKGDIEAVYTTNKKQLPSDVVEDMRSAYFKCCEFLETQRKKITQDEMDEKVKRYLLSFNGFTDKEIDELGSLSKYSLQELREISDKKRFGTNGKGGQKVIPAEEVKNYIVQGWEYVPNDFLEKRNEAIVRLPV